MELEWPLLLLPSTVLAGRELGVACAAAVAVAVAGISGARD